MNTQTSMKRFQTRAKEQGQALVLIAMLIVILLAALGLAIDGGGMFLLWRDAQNAVDAAALQSAFAYCTNGEDLVSAQEAGYTATLMNGFDNNKLDNWVTVDRAINMVSAAELPGNATVKNDIIMVKIVAEKPAYFIQLVYGGPMSVEVTALGVCNASGDNFFEGYAVYSMAAAGVCKASQEETNMNGSSANFFSAIGSNADIKFSGSDYKFYDGAGMSFVGYVDGLDKISNKTTDGTTPAATVPGSTTAAAEQAYTDFPVLYTWEQFVPGTGEIWNAIDEIDGIMGNWVSDPNLHYTTDNMPFEDAGMQGLYVIDNTGLSKASKDFTVGSKGITIVTRGQFSAVGSINSKADVNVWKPFTSSAGVTNALFFFSTFNPSGTNPPSDCGQEKDAGVNFSGSGIVGEGIIYTPFTATDWSSSQSYWCGAIIGLTFSGQASDRYFFSDEIPSDDVLRKDPINAADWFIESNFEGRNCDFFDSASPSIFLGDVGD